jgi:capsular polysaccharide biosynthesis protein
MRSLTRRHWWIVVLAVIVGGAAATAVTLKETKLYQASVQLVVGQSNSLLSSNASVGVQTYTQSVTQLLESNVVATEAIAGSGYHIAPKTLLDRLTVTNLPDSSVLLVQYDATSPHAALATLDSISSSFVALYHTNFARPGSALAATGGPVTITIFDPPHLTVGAVSPRKTRNVLLGIIAGLVVGLVLAIIREAAAPLPARRNGDEASGEPTP